MEKSQHVARTVYPSPSGSNCNVTGASGSDPRHMPASPPEDRSGSVPARPSGLGAACARQPARPAPYGL